MSWVLVFPIAVPFITAVFAYLARNYPAGRWISLAGSVLSLVASAALMVAVLRDGVIAAQMSNWDAPFGITLVADYLSAVMVVITAITGLATAIYALGEIPEKTERLGFYALFQTLIAGVTGAFLTGDLFNLYVWFEVMLIASFSLLVIGGGKDRLDAGIKYVALNLVSTLVFLSGIGLLYGITGTLNMADLRGAVAAAENQALVTVIAMMFMVGFGVKAAVFPLFFWLPASYHTPPIAISAFFAGMLTKVGVYALIRTFTLLFVADVGYTHTILLWVGGLTMVTGVLTAAAQSDVRKILSFHIISQIGYMIVGLALYTPLALAGAVFYLIHNIIAKANLFLIAGIARRLTGSFELDRIGGLFKAAPFLSALFLISALGLAGIPPLSGFWAKLLVVLAALEVANWWIAGVALGVGLLTLFSMTKIWQYAYWSPLPEGARLATRPSRLLYVPVVGLAALTLLLGLWSQPLISLGDAAAAELLDPSRYVAAVFGEGAPAVPSGVGSEGGAP